MASKFNYTKAVVICHGKSEVCMVRYIYTNLHLPIKIYANNNGKNSIQITSLKTLLDTPAFKNLNAFANEFDVETIGKGKQRTLCNFRLFMIMDTDDCTEQQREAYISKEMFKDHWLYDYIVPIYNISNLEEVMLSSGIMPKKIKTGDKGEYYEKIFPINSKPLSNDTLNDVNTFNEKVKNIKKTNIECFVDYCLSLVEKIQ